LGLEQRARGGKERLTVVDDETSLHHLPSISETRDGRNAASWRIETPGSPTNIGPPVAATLTVAVVILTSMLATETYPETQASMAPAQWAEQADDRRRLKSSDRVLIDRATRGFEVLQGKWKVHLIVAMARGIRRPSRLHACLPGISKKVMTDCLRGLERDGLVTRQIYAQVPVRVEYSLTSLGWTITNAIVALSEWGKHHSGDVTRARSEYGRRGVETDEILHARLTA
jgi:DNA-binding HxlR family transcriptional regulator